MLDKNVKITMLKQRIVPIGNIEEDRCEEVCGMIFQLYLENSRERINFIMDSDGGSVKHALRIYDVVKGLALPKKITVAGKCKSSGLIVLSAFEGRDRFSLPHSEFFFHAIRCKREFISTKPMAEQLKNIERDINRILDLATKAQTKGFNISKEKLRELQEDGEQTNRHLSAEEAVELGLISTIITENIF